MVCSSAKSQKLVAYSEKDPENIDDWETYQLPVVAKIVIENQEFLPSLSYDSKRFIQTPPPYINAQ